MCFLRGFLSGVLIVTHFEVPCVHTYTLNLQMVCQCELRIGRFKGSSLKAQVLYLKPSMETQNTKYTFKVQHSNYSTNNLFH